MLRFGFFLVFACLFLLKKTLDVDGAFECFETKSGFWWKMIMVRLVAGLWSANQLEMMGLLV